MKYEDATRLHSKLFANSRRKWSCHTWIPTCVKFLFSCFCSLHQLCRHKRWHVLKGEWKRLSWKLNSHLTDSSERFKAAIVPHVASSFMKFYEELLWKSVLKWLTWHGNGLFTIAQLQMRTVRLTKQSALDESSQLHQQPTQLVKKISSASEHSW